MRIVISILLRRFKCNDISTIVLFFHDLFAMEGHCQKFFGQHNNVMRNLYLNHDRFKKVEIQAINLQSMSKISQCHFQQINYTCNKDDSKI